MQSTKPVTTPSTNAPVTQPQNRSPDFRLIVLMARLYRNNFAMQSASLLARAHSVELAMACWRAAFTPIG
jgi:hypothetical protein